MPTHSFRVEFIDVCGMTGWVDYSRDLTRDQSVIEAMTETMACRGPDAAGVWLRPGMSTD